MLYGHGDNAYQYEQKIKGNFSSNVNFAGPSEALLKHLANFLPNIGKYPEVMAETLSCQLSEYEYINAMVTNGATEAFYLIAQAWTNCKTLIAIPSFAEYESACKVNKHTISFVKHAELKHINFSDYQTVWLCNPNNPDGYIFSNSQIENWLNTYTSTLFVIDEAYIDFVDGMNSATLLIKHHSNIIIIKSLTKKFAIPGLRLGYILSQKTNLDRIEQIRMPWSVNSLAIEAGKFLINNNCIRISTQNKETNALLVKTLTEWSLQ